MFCTNIIQIVGRKIKKYAIMERIFTIFVDLRTSGTARAKDDKRQIIKHHKL